MLAIGLGHYLTVAAMAAERIGRKVTGLRLILSAAMPAPEVLPNTHALGELLYTRYVYLFQAAGVVLLVAMIGAIVLTHRQREGVRKQRISDQLRRRAEDSVEVRDVPTGKGI